MKKILLFFSESAVNYELSQLGGEDNKEITEPPEEEDENHEDDDEVIDPPSEVNENYEDHEEVIHLPGERNENYEDHEEAIDPPTEVKNYANAANEDLFVFDNVPVSPCSVLDKDDDLENETTEQNGQRADENKENESDEDIFLSTPEEPPPKNRRRSLLTPKLSKKTCRSQSICIACSGLVVQEKDEVNKFVNDFGLKGAKDMKVDATHLVVKKNQDNLPVLTLKMFQGTLFLSSARYYYIHNK